jgi:hypothetical protein
MSGNLYLAISRETVFRFRLHLSPIKAIGAPPTTSTYPRPYFTRASTTSRPSSSHALPTPSPRGWR